MTHEINIADFAAFCRSKGEETFNPSDGSSCAVYQYGRSLFPDDAGLMGGYMSIKTSDGQIRRIVGLTGCETVSGCGGSFSALADRLEALMETADA